MLHYTYTGYSRKISQQFEDKDRLGTRRDYAGPFLYVTHELGWVNTSLGLSDFSDFINSFFPRANFTQNNAFHIVLLMNKILNQ